MHFIIFNQSPLAPLNGRLKSMESKNMVIAFAWTFVLVSVVTLYLQGEQLSFMGYLMFFMVALVATFFIEAIIPGTKSGITELREELGVLKVKLDKLDGDPQ